MKIAFNEHIVFFCLMASSALLHQFSAAQCTKWQFWCWRQQFEAFLMDLQKKFFLKEVSTIKIAFNEHIVFFCLMASSSSAPNFSTPKDKMAILTLTTAIWSLSHQWTHRLFCFMASSSSAPNFSSPEYKIAILKLTTAIWSLSHGFAKKNKWSSWKMRSINV